MLDFITQNDLPTVLLIDDDMVTREVMATILTMSGYSLHTADGGEQALMLLSAKSCIPSVILMDAQMPGLSGVPLIEQLRAGSQARLYVISASNPSEEIRSAADGFLLKPFPPEALTRLLQQHEAQLRPTPPPGLDPNEVIINLETLSQLREMMPDAAVRQIFEAIIADIGRRTAALESAIVKADWVETRRIGHAIKGGGAMAGAVQVARLGEMVESGALELAAVNQSDNSSVILSDLRAAALNLQRMLDAEIKA
jgi:CheY-like chemotaxis protein/HPt (histidine-containing phosphotransfer) domain-containing protein